MNIFYKIIKKMIFCEDKNSLEIFNKIQRRNGDTAAYLERPAYFYI